VVRQPIVRDGKWQLLECAPAWGGNWTWDCFVAFAWTGDKGERWLVVANYANNQSQCFLRLPFADLSGRWHLKDLLSGIEFDRDGAELQGQGLFLDVPQWQTHVFALTALGE
jgi:hypothetical protein